MGALDFYPGEKGRGSFLATAGTDGECHLWDVRKRSKIAQLLKGEAASHPAGPPLGMPAIAFSRSGEALAYARSDDWSGGEEQYSAVRAAGHVDEVRILLFNQAIVEKWGGDSAK